jgi:hypothetical protein
MMCAERDTPAAAARTAPTINAEKLFVFVVIAARLSLALSYRITPV